LFNSETRLFDPEMRLMTPKIRLMTPKIHLMTPKIHLIDQKMTPSFHKYNYNIRKSPQDLRSDFIVFTYLDSFKTNPTYNKPV